MPYRSNSGRAGKWRLLSNSNWCLTTSTDMKDTTIMSARWCNLIKGHTKSTPSTMNLYSWQIHPINPIRKIHLSSRNGLKDGKAVQGTTTTTIRTHTKTIKGTISSNKPLEVPTVISTRIFLFRIRTIGLSLTHSDLLTLLQSSTSSWRDKRKWTRSCWNRCKPSARQAERERTGEWKL
jgi:hypothetical protein